MQIVEERNAGYVISARLYELVENCVYMLEIGCNTKYPMASQYTGPAVEGVWITLDEVDHDNIDVIGIDDSNYMPVFIEADKYTISVIFFHEKYRPNKIVDRI